MLHEHHLIWESTISSLGSKPSLPCLQTSNRIVCNPWHNRILVTAGVAPTLALTSLPTISACAIICQCKVPTIITDGTSGLNGYDSAYHPAHECKPVHASRRCQTRKKHLLSRRQTSTLHTQGSTTDRPNMSTMISSLWYCRQGSVKSSYMVQVLAIFCVYLRF